MLFCVIFAPAGAQQWRKIFNGKNLDGWEQIGNGVWHVMADGTLVGQRMPRRDFPQSWPVDRKTYSDWLNTQAWLYTKSDYGEYDLHLEYWLPAGGNSGVSLRDPSRARYAITTPADFRRTPSKLGYEIQLNNQYPDPQPSGSIYTFVQAKTGAQKDNEWNMLDIAVRDAGLKVRLNGRLVAEHPGDPARPKTGPVGLQLHDQYSVVMFRDIRLREVPRAAR
jgi:hypothetical protein